jgi:hypothetical protein
MATSAKNGRYFIQSNLGSNGNFAVVIPGGTPYWDASIPPITLLQYYRINDVGPTFGNWLLGNNKGDPIVPAVTGGSALIEDSQGNFQLIVPTSAASTSNGQLYLWTGGNDGGPDPGKWRLGLNPVVGVDTVAPIVTGAIGGSALIQSNFMGPNPIGNFEVLVNVNGGLQHWWANNSAIYRSDYWHQGNGGNPIGNQGKPITGVIGSPALIQSNFGRQGNFEVLVNVNGGLQHWWRNNDATNVDTAWTQGNQGNSIVTGVMGSPALIQSNFGRQGNFEVLVNVNGGLQHWWRNNDATNVDTAWTQGNQGNSIVEGVVGSPALIQSNFGNKGNFEVMVLVQTQIQPSNQLFHWWRNNDATNVDIAWTQGNQGQAIDDALLSNPELI